MHVLLGSHTGMVGPALPAMVLCRSAQADRPDWLVPVRSWGSSIIRAIHLYAVLLERHFAIVLAQEVQEPLVIARVHVEEPRDDRVIAPCFLQPAPDDFAHVVARDFPAHE